MFIFSKFGFSGSKEESHELLARVIDIYNASERKDIELTGKELVESMKTQKNGKPYIENWLHFSISHSEDAWVMIIDTEPCGIDIQYPRECKMDKIMEKYYNKEEADFVREDGEESFWEIWTRREAAIKAVDLTVFDQIPPVLKNSVELLGEDWYLQRFEMIGAEEVPIGAICTKREPVDIHYFSL